MASEGFQIIEVSVAPGPLGILLNGDDAAHPAMLDGFAPISTDGDIGDVEKDGRVGKGSELIGVNEYDFQEWSLSFTEIGQVLRETGHLQRMLRFRVPLTQSAPLGEELHQQQQQQIAQEDTELYPLTLDGPSPLSSSFHEIDESEVEAALAVHSLSPPASSTTSWSVKDLRSPRSVADPSHSGSSSPKYDTNGSGNVSGVVSGATSVVSPETETQDDTDNQTEEQRLVQVDVPAGPLGLNLDGNSPNKALVLGFVPLPDGTIGAVQQSARVLPGSVIKEINGEDVSSYPLSEITALLGALSGEPRQLMFLLPDPAALAAQQAAKTKALKSVRSIPKYVEDLEKRRKMELALVLKHDATKIKRRECWFMVDANWMNQWVAFAARGGPLPGRITNETLLEDDWQAKADGDLPGRADAPREGLAITKDYRAVPPMVWCLFVELHGIDPKVPLLSRYLLDVYSEPPRKADLAQILTESRLKAASLVADLRDSCEVKVDE